jgi:hypothetical protein
MFWRSMGKSQIGIERARVWNWERRTKLLLVAALAYPFLVSLCDLLRALIARSRSPPNKKAKSGDLSRKSERYQAPTRYRRAAMSGMLTRLSQADGRVSSLSTSWPYLPNPKGCRRMKRKTSSILLMLVHCCLVFPWNHCHRRECRHDTSRDKGYRHVSTSRLRGYP